MDPDLPEVDTETRLEEITDGARQRFAGAESERRV